MNIKRILGVLTGVATVAYLVQLIGVLSGDVSSTQGTTNVFASFVPVCLAAAITVWLFRSPSKRR